MTDLIFPGHKSRKNAKYAKIKSAVRKSEKYDRSADRQMTDLIFRDTLVECAKDTIVRYLFLRKSHDEHGSGMF